MGVYQSGEVRNWGRKWIPIEDDHIWHRFTQYPWVLVGKFEEQVMNAMHESWRVIVLGDCGSELLLIFIVESIDPAYKVFRCDANNRMWVRMDVVRWYNNFNAFLGPDDPGIHKDYVYRLFSWAGGWSEYSLIEFITVKYPGEPMVCFRRPQVWVLPSLFCNWFN